MPLGGGIYNDLCTYVREEAQADAAIVIVLGGKQGSGFSVQAPVEQVEQVRVRLPKILEAIAAQIRADTQRLCSSPTNNS